MARLLFTCTNAELREASGESYVTLVPSGTLIIRGGLGYALITVGDQPVDFVLGTPNGPFKKIDSRTYMFYQRDLLTYSYISLPKGLTEAEYDRFSYVLECLRTGAEVLDQAPAPPAQEGGAHAAAPSTEGRNIFTEVGGLLKAVVGKAGHDTIHAAQMAGKAVQDKAAQDMATYGKQPEPKPST